MKKIVKASTQDKPISVGTAMQIRRRLSSAFDLLEAADDATFAALDGARLQDDLTIMMKEIDVVCGIE